MAKKLLIKIEYLNSFHKKSSEASQKEVESMQKYPLSWEDARKQVNRLKSKITIKTYNNGKV